MNSSLRKAIAAIGMSIAAAPAFSAISNTAFNSPQSSVVSSTCWATPIDQPLSVGDLYFLAAASKASPQDLNPLLEQVKKAGRISEKERSSFCNKIEQKEMLIH